MAGDIVARGVKRLTTWYHSIMARTLILVLCGWAALGGLGFIAVGSYLSLSEVFVPWVAGLIVGCGILLLSLLGAWLTILYWRSTPQPQAPIEPPEENTEAQTLVDTATHLGEIVGASLSKSGIRTTDVMIAALVAGTILGASPALRERLLKRKRYGPLPPRRSPR
ncbi:MAG: hypothetical protein LJE85_04685 [Gammaproteobacteria bacterium]|nr:hypothetical protein [Gammaproteobacteria bacterium]